MGKIKLSKAEYDRIMNYGTEKDPEYDPDALTYDDYVYGADAIRRRSKYLQSYRDYLSASGTANNVTGSFAGQERTNADSYRSELQGFLRYLETASKSALERGNSASFRAISQARDSLNVDPFADYEEEKQYLNDAKDDVTRQSERNRDYLGVRNPRGLEFHFSNAFGQSDKQSSIPGLTTQNTFGKNTTDSVLSASSRRTKGQAVDEARENNYAQIDPALAEEALMGFYATHPQDYTTNLPYTTAGKDRLAELAQQLRVSQQENEGSIARQRQNALEEEAARRQAWFDERADKYANIPLKDDFEQNIFGWEDVGKANDPLMTEAARGYELTVPLENRDVDTQNALKQQEADSAYNVSRMSPTERKVYRYLQNTEGNEAAQDYMDYLSYRLNARNMNEVRAAAERGTETTGGKIVHSALSVPANLAGGALGAADYAIQNVRSKFSYRPIDYNSGGQIPGEYASAVRENTQEDMGNVGRFVYGTAMSMADSAASMLTVGKGGGALLGLSAGRQGVKDAIDAGATDSQAIAMGLFNGAAEMIFENIGIDNLYSILESGGTRTFKSAVKSILGQALSEGTEEVGTTLANTWGDAMIMADKSEINRTIDEYMSEGASREQATRAAWLNWAQNLGMDFLGGFTSGALFGLGGTIIANAKNDSEIGRAFKQNGAPNGMRIEDAISEVTGVPNIYSKQTVNSAQNIRESGIENVSDRTLGRFYRLFVQDQQNLQRSGINDFDIAEYVERGMEPYQEPRTNVESSIARDEAGNIDVEQTLRNAAQETTAMDFARENEQSDANTRRAWEDALSMPRQNAKASNQNMPVTAQENAQGRSVASPEESVAHTQKSSQTSENGVQAAYVKGGRISDAEMSGSGAAKNNVQLASGETAHVQNISVSDNGVVLETNRGKALADDVQIDDPSLYTIVSAAEKYDTQGAQALFRGYENSDLSAQNYVRAFESAYESGHVGLDYGTLLEKGGYATFLDKDTRMAAYAAGQRVFTSDKDTAGVRGGVVEKFSGELTREQRAAVNALNAYGRAIGRTINIVDSIDVKKKDGSVRKSGANAMFNPKTNEYTIALDAQGQAYVAVALHESVHDISANQPQMYDMLHTTVMEYLKMEGEDIDALRAEWRDRIGDRSDAEIDEEIIGNTVPVILSDKETAQDFAERFLDSDEKKSAFRRLIDSILDFLKRAYDKLKNYKSWRTMKTLESNIQAVQDIREVMFDALDELRNGDAVQNDSSVEIKESEKSPKNDTKKVEQPASPLSRRSVKAENGRRYEPLATATTLFDIANIDEKSDSVKQAISALGDIYTSIETNKPLPNGRKTVRPSSLIGNMVSLGILKRGGEGGSAYRIDNGHTLRISDHSANSENFVDQGENLSVALFDKGRMNFFFEGKNNLIEAVFRTSYLEQNTDAFKNMIGDIARFIATGEYHDTAGALTYHYSGSESFVQEAQDRMLNDAVQRQINSVDEETAQRIIADEDGARYSSRDIDTETLDMLESLGEDELITTYRSMQLIDGKLYPPMAAVVSGSMEDASQIGSWERAVEHPELVKIDNKGRAKFTLNKGKGQGTISAAYNPYMHSSNLMLNDQFTGAYKRPNLVTVECVVPASEMTSGYHAEFAKDATGWHEWHAGPVASNVSEQRNVFLSRWLKPVRIVDNAEVAREYKRLLSGTNASVPYNVVSPGLLAELENLGVPIDNKGSGKVPPRDDIRYSERDDTEYMTLAESAESGDLDAKNELQDMVIEKAYSLGYTYRRNTRNAYNPQNNAAPYYMFVDMFGHTQDPLGDTYGPYRFVATDKNAIDVSDIANEIQTLARDYFGHELSDDELSPPDIVDSAGMWDNMDFVQEVWDNILERIYDETGEIPAVKTADGLLVFGADGKRIKSADPVVRDENGDIVPLSKRFDESSDNIRYSTRDYGEVKDEFDGEGDVEQTRDLIAVHNLTADELMNTLELEGFPMPSIAVIRANAGHSRYGDISVIFDKATIDPAQSRRNKIYGGDAWTPTFPDIEYEASSKLVDQIRDKYYAIPADVRNNAARPLYLLYTDADRLLAKYGGEKGLIEHYADDTDMMQAYLADSGKTPVATIQKQTVTRLDADDIKLYDYLSDKLGKDTFSNLRPKNGGSPATARKAWFAEYGDAFKSAYAQYLTQTGLSETDAQSVINDQPMSFFTLTAIKVHHYLANGAEKITMEPDYEATEAAIRKAVDPKAYESWLHGLLDGIEKGRGVRNNKELFTNAGNRRSFKSLHYEVSLENIVRAMMEETEKGGAMFPASGLFGLATKDYGSIDQVRSDKSRLAQLDEYAYTRMKQEYQSRFSDIAVSIMDKSTDNYFVAVDDATNALLEAVRRGKTQAGMRRVLSEYNHLNIQPDTTKQLYDLVQEIAQMPTEYFEAKPRRAVGLEEIAYVVLPDNADAQLKTALDERNIHMLEYKAGDEADRARVLNGEETKSVRFSLRDTSSVDIATVEKENAQLREANEELRKQFQRTVGVQLDQKAIRKMARDLLKQYDSSYDVDTLTDNLSKVFDVVANGGLTWDEASSAVVDMCRKVLEESSSFDAELYEYDQPVRDYLKNVRLEIGDDMRGGIELVADNAAAYRRGLFGIVGTAKKGSGVSIDQMWREASEMFPAYFSEDIVNAEDQAERLYHLAQRLKKSSYFVNAFAQNIDAAAYDMMLQIGAKYPGIPHTQTFADKFAAKVNEARAKTKKAYDAKLAQLRAQQKTANRTARRLDAKATKIANRMLQQQARYESQLESQNKKIDRMEAARDKAKDTARRKKYRDRIAKNATALYQWLAKPTDKAHVPENIRAAVTQLVRAIDLSSGTKYGEAWRQRLSALADQFDKSTLDAAYQSFANSIDPDLTTDIRAFVDSQAGVTVSDMDADHLQTLSELLNRVKKAVTEANKFHSAERSRTVQEVAIKTREEFNRKRVFSETKSGKAVQAIIDFNQADAVTLFHYLGKEAEAIYNAVRQGFDEYVFHVRDAQQYAVKVLEKAGDKKQYSKTHKFHVDGKDIELSVAQIMTLYELSQRPQAAEHLYDGGIVLIKRSATGTQKEKTHVRVTKKDVADMIAVLTDPQKTAADALQRFLQDDSAAWGNDATMTVYGYRKFGEDHYFPIDSDRDFISTSGKDSSNNGDLYALRNWRSSKSTVEGASNPLIVGDIFDVWTKHVSEMAKYGAYLAPMDDMLKWYNWRGRDGSGRQISVRESLNGAFGKKNAAKFVETFIKNINGSGRIDVAAQDKIFDTMVRNAKAAAVGANLSVAIQQPTAYARAYAEIDAKYLSLAFAQKPNTQLAQQYCPIAQWKAWGFFDVNVGPILKSVILGDKTWLEKIREVQIFMPELGDNVTWGYIWNACALEVADKENVPPDQRNTEEFYQKVGRRMSEVIDKTQVVDSPFTRSFISSNKGYQAFTAFQNEPMKSYNMLTRAAYDNVYEHTNETKKHLRRSIVAFVAAGVFAAMGKAIISALRRNDDKKGDSWAEKALIRLGMTEEGRYTYGQKWMVSALEETADNIFPLNTHWLTSAIVEMIERAVSGTNYSSGRIDEKTISSIEDFAKLIKKLTEGKDVETYRLVYKGAEMVSYLTGIGFHSLLKDGKGIWDAVSDAISPDYTPTMNDAFILIERGDVGSVEIAAALEAAANEILAKTPSISGEKAMQQAESDLRSKVTNRYKDDYINAFEKGYTQKSQQITEWMYATGLYEDRDAVDDVVRGWLVGYYKEAYLAAKTDAERSNIFEKLYATKKWRNRAELKKAIRGWTEAKD